MPARIGGLGRNARLLQQLEMLAQQPGQVACAKVGTALVERNSMVARQASGDDDPLLAALSLRLAAPSSRRQSVGCCPSHGHRPRLFKSFSWGVLHDWPDEDRLRILVNRSEGLPIDVGRLLMGERVMGSDPKRGQLSSYLPDMHI